MRIAVRRKDTGHYLYPSSYSTAQWGPDLQYARLFGRKADATNSGRNSLPHGLVNGRWTVLPDAPELEQIAVVLSLVGAPAVLPVDVRDRLDLLDALEAAGVDNWEGYSIAMEEMGAD